MSLESVFAAAAATDPGTPLRLVRAQVVGLGPVRVNVDGINMAASHLSSYSPEIGDLVAVLVPGRSGHLILGKVQLT